MEAAAGSEVNGASGEAEGEEGGGEEVAPIAKAAERAAGDGKDEPEAEGETAVTRDGLFYLSDHLPLTR